VLAKANKKAACEARFRYAHLFFENLHGGEFSALFSVPERVAIID